ncbi:MAG: NAD(P)/FAD-dependent oxidoreductase [Deltaproteobacteria bacterium]|nr:NAD(P)/FAD-dependent oxidoreductase [Deltaproteobacteria bacterium]
MEQHDVIIIGAGHNGLAVGCYLARAGLDVLVLERRAEFGGGLSTEECTLPGFYHNLHSNFHGAMPFFPPYVDFELGNHGLRYIHPPANIGMPLRDGRALVLYIDERRSYEEIARFSKRDAETWLELRGVIASHVGEILSSAYSAPLQGRQNAEAAEQAVTEALGGWFGSDLSDQSAIDLVTSRFENPHVQALALFHMAVGGWDVRERQSATLGVAFLGHITNWQLCRGGSHHLAHVLGTVLLQAGGDLREHCHVSRILLDDRRATGVELADGTPIGARMAVVSTVEPHQTFELMLEPGALPSEAAERARAVRYGHGDVLFGVHLALSEPPHYAAARDNPDIDRTFNVNIGYETPADLLEHYEEIDRNELPRTPRLEVGVNTLFDPSQAPAGKHTAVLWQFTPFAPGVEDDGSAVWDELKDEYAERCIAQWRKYAPNMTPDKVLGVYAYTPHDIAQKVINMRRGGFHCSAVLDSQLFHKRPFVDVGSLRTPIEGLYLGGASVHPYGGILAGPAYNCVQVLADDFDLHERLKLKPKIWDEAAAQWNAEFRAKGLLK